ncbi:MULTISPECIES: ATP-binding cassette domain-containing protein [unclassified Aliivibrio]|uniref:ATP-binding cassette domain-containing protein n=1 Tax=unclassified Aliivibrio TaxID=2645654 RepID=UPI00080E7F1F|nr:MULTISPECIES: ATP-binding cassette domain-containing protein [unclassified Aliivibrio]OCH15562.1 ABC transporter ATP-binding protein [Aliivibrio sp. 1S128]OCH18167.1 ABC transporter ATP-binding protein [Aliivibrio sp. 1S165]OCH35544.1 ABC transporter ATP-binding protein [Aliivibrio sp. 1S175]
MNLPIVSVSQLSISTPSKVLFSDVTFDVSRGELLAIMGPSGIGKSMLSRAIAGFTADPIQVKGYISLSGHDVSNVSLLHRTAAQRPAFIFQDALQALNPLVSIEGQLCLSLTRSQTKPNKIEKKTLIELLKKLEFSEPDLILPLYPSQLSGGQRQRICIAIGLLSKAEILIADEPTSALDPITEKEILTLIRENVKQKQLAGILITHNLSSALACDKLLIIDDGGMVAYGPPREALENSSHSFCCSLKDLIA